MDLQDILNAKMAQLRQERLSSSPQLLLGELKLKLEAIVDKSKPIEFDFGQKPAGASSWRGSYQELGLEYSETGGGSADWNSNRIAYEYNGEYGRYISYENDGYEIPENPTVDDFLNMLSALTGKDMIGYKGGEFTMHKGVAVYISNYGDSSVANYRGKDYATVAPVDILEMDDRVIIATSEVQY